MKYSDDPFEHWIVDDFLPTEMARAARDHFHEGTGEWIRRHHLYSRHKRTRTQGLSEPVEKAMAALECPGMLAYISALTGVSNLRADSMRFGGGQHVTTRGGSLGIHADFTHHPQNGMRRALNLLLYLNDTDTGELELWEKSMQRRVRLVLPCFNRAVIFKTSVTSYHGHPEALQEDERLSLAAYYYVQPEYEWLQTGIPDITYRGSLKDYLRTTDYRPRPWEYGLRLRRWVSKMVKG